MDKVERQIRRVKGRELDRKGPGASSARDAVEQLEDGRLGVSDQAGGAPEGDEDEEGEADEDEEPNAP